ncbi:translation initiation factor IF-2-like [Motacilla alba alba]|uniref:translation initiation factor IF-2-like n=1 Tax=Motacilla alba alba TaxID=1094192 RepID=UPI0018D52421|nr:translation initiation factor IF-2-like [Motacilla alba alba]
MKTTFRAPWQETLRLHLFTFAVTFLPSPLAKASALRPVPQRRRGSAARDSAALPGAPAETPVPPSRPASAIARPGRGVLPPAPGDNGDAGAAFACLPPPARPRTQRSALPGRRDRARLGGVRPARAQRDGGGPARAPDPGAVGTGWGWGGPGRRARGVHGSARTLPRPSPRPRRLRALTGRSRRRIPPAPRAASALAHVTRRPSRELRVAGARRPGSAGTRVTPAGPRHRSRSAASGGAAPHGGAAAPHGDAAPHGGAASGRGWDGAGSPQAAPAPPGPWCGAAAPPAGGKAPGS